MLEKVASFYFRVILRMDFDFMFIIYVMDNFVKPSVKGNPQLDNRESAPLNSLQKPWELIEANL